LFKKYPGRFLVLHIKDDRELGESGMVGFDAIFKNLDAAGTKYLIVEVERYNRPPVESVKASLDYLNAAPFVKNDYSGR
jgi:sugar phosphate isomerase/epimerase